MTRAHQLRRARVKKRPYIQRGFFDKDVGIYRPHPAEENQEPRKSGVKYGTVVLS